MIPLEKLSWSMHGCRVLASGDGGRNDVDCKISSFSTRICTVMNVWPLRTSRHDRLEEANEGVVDSHKRQHLDRGEQQKSESRFHQCMYDAGSPCRTIMVRKQSKMQPHPGTMDKSEPEKAPPGTQFRRLGKGSPQKQAHNHTWKADRRSLTGEHCHIR
jgi:hypothetical protein